MAMDQEIEHAFEDRAKSQYGWKIELEPLALLFVLWMEPEFSDMKST